MKTGEGAAAVKTAAALGVEDIYNSSIFRTDRLSVHKKSRGRGALSPPLGPHTLSNIRHRLHDHVLRHSILPQMRHQCRLPSPIRPQPA